MADAQAHLAELIESAVAGEEVILALEGKPELRIALAPPRRLTFGCMRGEIRIADDFDEFGPELAEMFGMDEA